MAADGVEPDGGRWRQSAASHASADEPGLRLIATLVNARMTGSERSAFRVVPAPLARRGKDSSSEPPGNVKERWSDGLEHELHVSRQIRTTWQAAKSASGFENTLKVETRVQIPLGLRRSEAMSRCREGHWPRIGPAAYTGPSRLKRSGPAPSGASQS
jgi:hypothetical protein